MDWFPQFDAVCVNSTVFKLQGTKLMLCLLQIWTNILAALDMILQRKKKN